MVAYWLAFDASSGPRHQGKSGRRRRGCRSNGSGEIASSVNHLAKVPATSAGQLVVGPAGHFNRLQLAIDGFRLAKADDDRHWALSMETSPVSCSWWRGFTQRAIAT